MDILNNNNVYKPESGERAFDIFNTVVRPMFQVGHEGELIEWLKEMGLLRRGARCKTTSCDGRLMVWTPARVVDKYYWTCPGCSHRIPIRDSSFFSNLKCGLKIIIQAIMGWCMQTPIELVCQEIEGNNAPLKQNLVKRVFDKCNDVVSCYVMLHWQKWCLGGPNSVVLIDVFPEGYLGQTTKPDKRVPFSKKGGQQILCLADLSSLPPRTWLQIIKADHQKETKVKSGLVEDALQIVRRHVRPGTSLVANYKARCCSMEAVRELEGYESSTSVEMLMQLDQPGTRQVQENLETIWQSVTGICEEVLGFHQSERAATTVLHEYMWRQCFAQNDSTAFENLLHHISEKYSYKD